MDENTERLLANLAEKLGTTAEHLWSVLVKQAPVSCFVDLIGVLACAMFSVWSVWYFRNHGRIDGEPGLSAFWLVALGFFAGIVSIIGIFQMGTILSGFFNPEYWALKQIIR